MDVQDLAAVTSQWSEKYVVEAHPGQGTSQDTDSEVEMECVYLCVCDSEKGIFLILA